MHDFTIKSNYNIDDLIKMLALLRSPNGCPWDGEQTHASIRQNVIEEAYEVAEAIDRASPAMLQEELGDLLMQVVFHSQISLESGGFCFDDVADGAVKKLVARHPHIFGDVEASNSEQVLSNWERIKSEEKHHLTLHDSLAGIAKSLPALMRSQKICKKLAKADAHLPEPTNELISELFALCQRATEQGIDLELELHRHCERIIEEQK